LRTRVIELDERVRRVRTRANPELVDLDRADTPNLLGRRLGIVAAAPLIRPLGVAGQIAVESLCPDVMLKIALAVSPAATASANVFEVSFVPETNELHCLFGTEMLKRKPAAGAPVVFVKVMVISCENPGVNVCSPGGVAIAAAGAKLSRWTSYPAPTIFACTS
jgi:hypothetical protein